MQLDEGAAAHATRVMRLRVGDNLTLFDGSGNDFACNILNVQKNVVLVSVNSVAVINNESPINITLLLGISAGDRMDIGLQKAVELGVNRIIPLKIERSIVKLDDEKAKKRTAHWQQVVIAACEQSGRAVVPTVAAPIHLANWLAQNLNVDKTRITLDPLADKKMVDLPKPTGEIQLLVGAEGGLSASEIVIAAQHGFIGVRLGKRILRTETAPLAAIATANTLWGDF